MIGQLVLEDGVCDGKVEKLIDSQRLVPWHVKNLNHLGREVFLRASERRIHEVHADELKRL